MKEQDLTLVGLTEDKQKLVLVSDSGEEFTLPADTRLRAALRGEHARLGQLEITMESALRPRDIQARIRAGESPENVAAAAQTSIEKIMGYATPVLAERAHIADRAQRASVRRKAGEGPARLLGDVVAERLRTRNVDPGTVEWDSWRREDGRWTLVADYRAGERNRHAEFVFDAPGRYVVAEDDEARWLVGEQPVGRATAPRTGGTPRRLSAVGDDQELPLGEDAIGMVAETPPAPTEATTEAPTGAPAGAPVAEEPTEDLSATAAAVRGTGDADWIATQASERPAPVELGSESDPEVADPREPTGDSSDSSDSSEPAAEPPADEPAADEPGTPRRTAKKKSRASVPSWDEIMFGGGKRE